ncbi:UNVERIFIED_CONTAM: hypothetical protein Sradi_2967400 [Sesamum radiatum]|uniref:Reverse transcriptase domain-containing protein n=1 Tax=Sesamum radiatum TaxID=300843 RepID=A0AAW2RZM4_SESRA
MECVSTSSFSVALNGSLHGFFPGKRGFRQGDPMSPALFLLSMEFFSRLVKRRTSDLEFNFHLKCEKLKITHLLFTDDLMLFSRSDLPSIHILMECLQEFQDVSGLAVNTSKSSIFMAGIDELHGILARTEARCQFTTLAFPLRHRGFRSPTTPHLWTKLPNPSPNGRLSPFHMWESTGRLGENLPSQGGRRSGHPTNTDLEHSAPCSNLMEHPPYGRHIVGAVGQWCLSQRRLSLGLATKEGRFTTPSTLVEIRNRLVTEFGSSEVAIQHMEAWTNNKGLETFKAYEYFRPKRTRRPWQTAIWKEFVPSKYSFILWLWTTGNARNT